MRHSIRRDALWSAPLRLIGVKDGKAFVEVTDDAVKMQFGSTDVELPLSNIADVKQRDWHWLYGIGIRIAKDKTLGLVGSTKGVVQVALKEPSESGVMGMRHPRNVAVSMEDPEAFIDDVKAHLTSN